MKRLIDWFAGSPNWGVAGVSRSLHGLRKGDQRELYIGLSLAALAFIRRSAPRKELVYRKAVPEGSAIVVHNRRRGAPKIEVIKPRKRRSSTD
jgi:hypothetical protein